MFKQKLIICMLTLLALTSTSCNKIKSNPLPLTTSPSMTYMGVNLSGAESGSKYPGIEGQDYIWPTPTQVDYFTNKKMNTFRINFMWERLQPTANGEFNAVYLTKLKTLVNYTTSKGATVLLNPQNFARYYGKTVGSTDVPTVVFADFWRRMAIEFKDNPKVMFGLVNEPREMSTRVWRFAAQDAINAIRATGAKNVITVPGNGWTGMHSWQQNWYDTSGAGLSNAEEMIKITDSANNFIFEVHQYLDSDFGGGYESKECVNATVGSDKAKPFVAWLRSNNKKAILAEVGAPNTTLCKTAMNDILTYLHSNSDVMVGWLWWNTIRDNFWGSYILDLTPKNGQDDSRMSWLSPFLSAPTPIPTTTIPVPTPVPTITPTIAPTCCPCTPTVDAGSTILPLTANAQIYTTWNTGYCANLLVKNNSNSTQSWHTLKVAMNGSSMRDYWDVKTTSIWGAKGEISFTPNKVVSIVSNKEVNVGGFCADGSSSNKATIVSVN